MSDKALGVIGGTFDPIHYGHLAIAFCAADEFNLEKVIFVPSAIPPHKVNKNISPPEMRYEMTLLATMDNPKFAVSRVELERKGASYTVDTLKFFKARYPQHKIFFITGFDTILDIKNWKSPSEVLELAYFITVVRPGYSLNNLTGELFDKYREKIFVLKAPQLEISSTEIRKRVKAGKSIKYYLHPAVESYIEKNELYR